MPKGKGWFDIEGRPGDRTLAQQKLGLDMLWTFIREGDKTVLDVGCAEGFLSIEAALAGAKLVHGIEIIPSHVAIGNKLAGTSFPGRVTFSVADAGAYRPIVKYDVVLMLAILQKLRYPYEVCRRFAAAANEMCVLRLPPQHAPIIKDKRSRSKPYNMDQAMQDSGFKLVHVDRGPFEEWVGYYRRNHA